MLLPVASCVLSRSSFTLFPLILKSELFCMMRLVMRMCSSFIPAVFLLNSLPYRLNACAGTAFNQPGCSVSYTPV